MEWITTKHIESTDGKTENTWCELKVNFPKSRWNPNEESPIIEIRYHDRKNENGWWIDRDKTIWYTQHPRKFCEVRFNYFQRQPSVSIYSDTTDYPVYENFNIDYCKEEAVRLFKERLNDILIQL